MENKSEDFQMEKFFEKQLELFEVRFTFLNRIFTLVIASVSLIAALAWDDALKLIFDRIFGGRETIGSALLYAIIITVLATIISISFGKSWFKKNQ